jgi:hypothetical protein
METKLLTEYDHQGRIDIESILEKSRAAVEP